MKLDPTGAAVTEVVTLLYSAICTCVAVSSCGRRVLSVTSATAAMDARASPLNPYVLIASKSSAVAILDVACLSKQSSASDGDMPQPLSITCMRVRPESVTITLTEVAPASTAFSMSSLITEAGRCTTSPAAIMLAMLPGSILRAGIAYRRV